MLASRYECKYVLSDERVRRLRTYVQPFVRPDPYAAKFPGYRYPICSLYLDSSDLRLYRSACEGNKNRFKLRIRTYGDGPHEPLFFEIKRRMSGVIYKRRAAIERARALGALQDSNGAGPPGLAGIPGVEEFAFLARQINARPVVRVKYMREAYESIDSDPVRITFDTELVHALASGPDVSHEPGPWHSTPAEGVVLEIKFTERFPSWVADLVEVFELQRQGFSKYGRSLVEVVGDEPYRLGRLQALVRGA